MNHNDEVDPDMECMFKIVKQRYEDRLTPEELKEVKEAVKGIRKMAAALKTVKLNNDDEPFTRFVPYREEI